MDLIVSIPEFSYSLLSYIFTVLHLYVSVFYYYVYYRGNC